MNKITKLSIIATFITGFILVNSTNTQASTKYENEMLDTIDSIYTDLQHVFDSYPVPALSLRLDGETSPCGVINSSFYCKKNKTIYATLSDIEWAYKNFGKPALVYIIAHEYAHYILETLKIKFKNTTNSEVYADCWTGIALGTLHKNNTFNIYFSDEDRIIATNFAATISDNQVYSINHHGTPEIRIHAFNAGFDRRNKKDNPYWGLLCGGIN